MKSVFKSSVLLCALLQLAGLAATQAATVTPLTGEQMKALLGSRPELDEIRWKDPSRGAPIKVRIMGATAQTLTVEKVLPAGLKSQPVPLSDLSGLEFTLTPREFAMHQQADPAAVGALRVLWESRQATIRIPGSNVSETGLVLAKSLRMAGDAAGFEEAGKILDQIRLQDPIDYRKEAARAEISTIGFVRSLKNGKMEDTEKLAWKITEEATNPDAMVLATAFLADRNFTALKEIEDENPRWMEDDKVKPVRDRVYNLALDFALYPSLFLGTRALEASSGLKKACDIYQFTGQNVLAKGTLEDMAALYPDSEATKESAPLLAKLKQLEAAGRLAGMTAEKKADKAEDSKESKDEDMEHTPDTPPTPKRYNIFGD